MTEPGAASVSVCDDSAESASGKTENDNTRGHDGDADGVAGSADTVHAESSSSPRRTRSKQKSSQSLRKPSRSLRKSSRKYRQYTPESVPRVTVSFRLESSLREQLYKVVRREKFTGIGDALETAVKEFLANRAYKKG